MVKFLPYFSAKTASLKSLSSLKSTLFKHYIDEQLAKKFLLIGRARCLEEKVGRILYYGPAARRRYVLRPDLSVAGWSGNLTLPGASRLFFPADLHGQQTTAVGWTTCRSGFPSDLLVPRKCRAR